MKHQARKRFGQHFLVDQSVLTAIVQAIGPKPSELMVEIGPGHGALTQWLVRNLNHLHVIELDRDLAENLRYCNWAERLTVHEGDVLQFDFNQLRPNQLEAEQPVPKLRVVGNLPYNISSPILFALLGHIDEVQDQTFMLQKEVVDRMIANPGHKEFGRLSVMLQAYYHMEHLLDVLPEAFSPPPRVDSAVVHMAPKSQAERESIPKHTLEKIVTAAFSQRRKMLRNNWANLVPEEMAQQANVRLTSRAEDVSTSQYIQIAQSLTQIS